MRRTIRNPTCIASAVPAAPGAKRGDSVHRAARAQSSARHRTGHASANRTHEPSDGRCGERPRIDKFKARIIEAAANEESKRYRPILEQLEAETDLAPIDIAAALASLAQSSTPLCSRAPTRPAVRHRARKHRAPISPA